MAIKQTITEVSVKNTKEQILAAYNDVLNKLSEKQIEIPQQQKKLLDEQKIVEKAYSQTSDTILTDLSSLKSKSIKQIDNLSQELLAEFQKLANLREAISLEQRHLQELYQINEVANTLSALLQAQSDQKEKFKLEMEQIKQAFEAEISSQKSEWNRQKEELERNYKELKDTLEKTRKREEEEYSYALTKNRLKEADEYNSKRTLIEKGLLELKDDLQKREADLIGKEQNYAILKIQVEELPHKIQEAVGNSEELLRSQLVKQYEFENQIKEKEYDGTLRLKEQSINYLEDKIKKQDQVIKELTEKADIAAKQVQSIACKALDTSGQRFVTMTSGKTDEKN